MALIVRGRTLSGRGSPSQPAPATALTALALAGIVVVTRLPFRTRYLLNWDADQFALGLNRIDLVHHQPHPPGYLGYLLLGDLFEHVWPEPNSALVVLSIAGEAAAIVLIYLFGTHLFGHFAGLVSGLALAASPLFWYCGEAANTYALEPLLVLAVAWACWSTSTSERAARYAPLAGLLLGVAGAIRPSTAVLLTPLFISSLIWGRRLIPALGGLTIAGLLTLAWLLRLVWVTGGPASYWHALLQLGGSVTTGTAIWRAGSGGLALTSGAVLLGVVWELGAFAVLAAFGLTLGRRLARSPAWPEGWIRFLLLWTLPGMTTFLLIHIGEVVYVQVFTPALCLVLGPALATSARALGRPGLQGPLLAIAVVANVAIFLLPAQESLAGQLAGHDRWVAALASTVSSEDPARTVLITDAVAVGSYRTAQVYLPEYHRVAIGRDRRGRVGEIYGDAYEPWGFAAARPLSFPTGATTFVFLDGDSTWNLIGDPELLSSRKLTPGHTVLKWRGPPPFLVLDQIFVQPAE